MRVFTQTLSTGTGTLTGYVQDNSPEMLNVSARPAMLIFPGGGYHICSDREAEPVAIAYLDQGYNAFVVRYSVGRESTYEQAFADAQAALAYLHQNADALSIDPQRIAAVGFSAGGHLAACLGVYGTVKPAALVLGYPCILSSCGGMLGKQLPGAEKGVDKNTPPTFLFSTQGDNVVPIENSLRFIEALEKAGVLFEEHIFLSGDHGLSLARSHTCSGKADAINADVAQWLPMSVRFLKNLWGDFESNGAQAGTVQRKDVLDLPLRKVFEKPGGTAILEQYLPQLADRKELLVGLSLRRLAAYSKGMIPDEMLETMAQQLRTLFEQD